MKPIHLLMPVLLLLPAAAGAFNTGDSRWPAGETVFHVGLTGRAPSGISWSEAFEDAMAEWNEKTEFRFYRQPAYRDPCAGYFASASGDGFPGGGGDGYNGVDFGDSMCGNDLGSGVVAVTLIQSRGGQFGAARIQQTDIIFNTAFDWDIYGGRLRREQDFRRTALHELGHALGLGHEESAPAIMYPRVSNIDSLQADDIAGVDVLYGAPRECQIQNLPLNGVVNGSLGQGDCRVLDLYQGGSDTSYVDTYRLSLSEPTDLTMTMSSSSLDAVLVLTDERLEGVELDDDSAGNCNARISGRFPAGDYLLLANTYDVPHKCGGNTGNYTLSVSDNSKPPLADARNLAGLGSSALFTGGASKDGGRSWANSFSADDGITVSADILPAQEHQGMQARFYVLAILEDGSRYVRHPDGAFRLHQGGLDNLPAWREGQLGSRESIEVIRDFIPAGEGIRNTRIDVYVGYAPEGSEDIIYNGEPISFTVGD